jgi:hypothetical protein
MMNYPFDFTEMFPILFKKYFLVQMRKLDKITCPICNEKFIESESLLDAFSDDTKTKYLSNLVRHYRHSHIRYWNKCWGPYGDKYRGHWFKRQIIRKAGSVLKNMGIGPRHFRKLQETDFKTIDLALKVLGQD